MTDPHTARWDAWNRDHAPEYPHEKAVQFVLRRFGRLSRAERAQVRIAVLGCGTGRHCLFLAREGFDTLGRDIAPVAIARSRDRLAQAGLSADLAVAPVDAPAIAPGSCDAVLCIGVLDAAGPAAAGPGMAAALAALRPGGVALFVFASDADFRVQGANPLGLHGYSDAEVTAALAACGPALARVWRDRYVTTYEDGDHAQNDHLLTLFRAP